MAKTVKKVSFVGGCGPHVYALFVAGNDLLPVAVPLPMLDLRPSWVRGAEASEGTKAMA